MRIGIVAPVWIPVPPQGYGGVEVVVSLLTEELVARGHDVTLFASGDSRTRATLRSAYETAPTERIWEVEPDAVHLGTAYRFACASYEAGNGFDLIHDNTDHLGVAFAACVPSPVVHTVHMPLDDRRREFLARFDDDVYLAAISDFQRKEASELNWQGTVHNAVDVDSFMFRRDKEDYVLCIGRICERKGQDLAIEVARQAGRRIVLAGRVHPKEAEFFERRVLPLVDGESVQFAGEVSAATKRELMAGASAVVFPVREPEPFGLVLVEAAASGTPVVATPVGAVPEIVVEGETGFLATEVGSMAEALSRVGTLSPERCREVATERFHPRTMADRYEALYQDVLAQL
jgi:glycosyltransferase involved in cell wall biosynthesis